MEEGESVVRRTGGRSARVRAAVIQATLEVLGESGFEGLGIAEVARRAGVHETSIYRRWRTRDHLVLDALVEFSSIQLPTPDQGSLIADLVELGSLVARYADEPLGRALLRAMATTDDGQDDSARQAFWLARYEACRIIVDRAAQRGEPYEVDARELLELFIAPLHFRLLLTHEPIDRPFLERTAVNAVSGCDRRTSEKR